MSESMTVEQKMARSVETWRKCDPILMASQSQAALTFAFRDMKRDILVLADEVERLKWNKDIAEAALLSVEKERDAYKAANGLLVDQHNMDRKERDELLSRLPDGMKHCTIVFKECEKGHGWLTATNWVQHGCPTCERDELRRQNDDLILKQFDHIGSGNKAVRRIKAAAVREACDKVVSDYRAVSFDKNDNLYLNIIALRDYANQIEGGA